MPVLRPKSLLLFFSIIMGAIHMAPFAQSDKVEEDLESIRKESQSAVTELEKSISPEDMAKLQEAMQSGDQAKINEATAMMTKNLAGKEGGMDKLLDLSLKSFREKSPSELRAELEKKSSASIFGPVIETFPKSLDLVVNLFQDPVALPKLFTIPKDRKRLLNFLIVNIVIFISAWIFKKVKKGKAPFSRWIFFFSLRMGVLFFFFSAELIPTLGVFKRTFF